VSRPAVPDLSPEDTEDLSPLPRGKPTRRGGVSAEPVTEEEATSYVKKVSLCFDREFLVTSKPVRPVVPNGPFIDWWKHNR